MRRSASSRLRIRRVPKGETSAIKSSITPTTLDIAWAAGIFEGEGCVQLRKIPFSKDGKQRKYVSLCTQVTQKDWWLPFRMRDLFGGVVNYHFRPKGSCNLKKFDSHIYNWQASGPRAAGFLMTIYTFLSDRRKEQVELALQGWNVRQNEDNPR